MPKATLEEAKDWTVLPGDTIITVKVLESQVETLDGKYGPWDKLNVTFEIVDVPDEFKSAGDLVGSKIWGGVPFKFEDDPDNQLKNWTEAILGFDVSGQLGFELDTDDWVGKTCRAVTRHFVKRNGKEGHGVDSLLPLGSGMMAAPANAAAALVDAQAAGDDVPF